MLLSFLTFFTSDSFAPLGDTLNPLGVLKCSGPSTAFPKLNLVSFLSLTGVEKLAAGRDDAAREQSASNDVVKTGVAWPLPLTIAVMSHLGILGCEVCWVRVVMGGWDIRVG